MYFLVVYCLSVRRRIFFILAFLLSFNPLAAFAVDSPSSLLGGGGSGLVPIPGIDGSFYRACDLLTLAQNVINFGIAFSVIVATLMFAYAGILYVTSASGGAEQVKKAHKVLINVFVGLCVALTAWLLIDITFSVLTGRGLAVWTKISCVSNPVTGAFPAAGNLPTGGSVTPGGAGPVATGGRCTPLTSGYCAPSNLVGYFGANATTMSSICHLESGGNPSIEAGTDRLWSSDRGFSYGLFQVNLTQHDITCNGRVTDCTAAFNPPSNPDERRHASWCPTSNYYCARAGAGFGYTIKNEALYNQCVALAKNPTCNLENAQNIYNGEGMSAWATSAGKCNLN